MSLHVRLEDFNDVCPRWNAVLSLDGQRLECLGTPALMLERMKEGGVSCNEPVLILGPVSTGTNLAETVPDLCGSACGECSESCYRVRCYSREQLFPSDGSDLARRVTIDNQMRYVRTRGCCAGLLGWGVSGCVCLCVCVCLSV